MPTWVVLASAAIGATATLLGNVVYWYLRRRERTDSQRAITHEKQLEMALDIDRRLQSLFDLYIHLGGAIGKVEGLEDAASEIAEEEGIDEVEDSRVRELKEKYLDEDELPSHIRKKIAKEALELLTALHRGIMILPEETTSHTIGLQRIGESILDAKGDVDDEDDTFQKLWSARTEFILSVRDNLLVEELTTQTRDLVRATERTLPKLSDLPRPYLELGIRTGEQAQPTDPP